MTDKTKEQEANTVLAAPVDVIVSAEDALNLIKKEELLLRPSLVNGWWCAKWKGVTGDNRSYCFTETIGKGITIIEAVNNYLDKKQEH